MNSLVESGFSETDWRDCLLKREHSGQDVINACSSFSSAVITVNAMHFLSIRLLCSLESESSPIITADSLPYPHTG